MTTNLQDILGELYAIDPDLRAHEQELLPILKKMMKMKPIAEPDEAFIQRLRILLREKATMAQNSQFSIFHPEPVEGLNSQFLSFFSMNHLQYTVTGLVLGAIIAAPLTYSLTQSGDGLMTTSESDRTQKLFSYSVEETSSESFGDLSVSAPAGMGGGGNPVDPSVSTDMMKARPQSGGGGGDMDRMMIAPDMTEYNLKFEGTLPELAGSVDVFKRLKNASAADMTKILGSFNTGLIDLKSFAGAKTDMISFYQDTKYGYMGTVSFREGSISLNQNWEQWPHPESSCQDEACFQRYRLKMEEIPADDVLIGIAQKFVNDHNVDLSQYDAPEVDRQWKTQYETATDKSMIWIPDTVRVVFPLMVDGKPVYEEGGQKAGINVGVHAREKRVSDVWGIMDQKYQKSGYTGVTDESTIRGYLENYGKMDRSWMPPNTTVKSADVTLGTPTVSLVRIYTYANNINEELLVPALVFPVTSVSGGAYFYNESITVPLAADLLKERTDRGNPVPMPLIMEDAARTEGQE